MRKHFPIQRGKNWEIDKLSRKEGERKEGGGSIVAFLLRKQEFSLTRKFSHAPKREELEIKTFPPSIRWVGCCKLGFGAMAYFLLVKVSTDASPTPSLFVSPSLKSFSLASPSHSALPRLFQEGRGGKEERCTTKLTWNECKLIPAHGCKARSLEMRHSKTFFWRGGGVRVAYMTYYCQVLHSTQHFFSSTLLFITLVVMKSISLLHRSCFISHLLL